MPASTRAPHTHGGGGFRARGGGEAGGGAEGGKEGPKTLWVTEEDGLKIKNQSMALFPHCQEDSSHQLQDLYMSSFELQNT